MRSLTELFLAGVLCSDYLKSNRVNFAASCYFISSFGLRNWAGVVRRLFGSSLAVGHRTRGRRATFQTSLCCINPNRCRAAASHHSAGSRKASIRQVKSRLGRALTRLFSRVSQGHTCSAGEIRRDGRRRRKRKRPYLVLSASLCAVLVYRFLPSCTDNKWRDQHGGASTDKDISDCQKC